LNDAGLPARREIMAYKIGANQPQPHLAGEFFANWDPHNPPVGQRNSDGDEPNWSMVRRGRPQPAGGRSSAQMSDLGWIGLYLIHDRQLPDGAEVIPTPQWMREPPPA
jgi:hypothetical protein